MMQNIDEDRRKQEERLAKIDPKKAAQAERLGLGMGSVVGGGAKTATTGAAHSIASGIVDVQQDGVRSAKPAAAARAAYDGECVDASTACTRIHRLWLWQEPQYGEVLRCTRHF